MNRRIEMGRVCVVYPCHWLYGEHSHSSASFCIQQFRSNCNYAIVSLHNYIIDVVRIPHIEVPEEHFKGNNKYNYIK